MLCEVLINTFQCLWPVLGGFHHSRTWQHMEGHCCKEVRKGQRQARVGKRGTREGGEKVERGKK